MEIWVRWADGMDHSPVKRRKGNARSDTSRVRVPPKSHEAFQYLQKNPKNLYTGDCVIRAMAAVLDTSWDDALDRILDAGERRIAAANTPCVFERLLEKEGFVFHSEMRLDGRKLRGKTFCYELGRMFHAGERVFAYVGNNHVAAILPFDEEGKTKYKIVDNWDSSTRLIGKFWVKTPTRVEQLEEAGALPALGASVIHPVFGEGCVQSIHPLGYATVDFAANGIRMLDCKWIAENCVVRKNS